MFHHKGRRIGPLFSRPEFLKINILYKPNLGVRTLCRCNSPRTTQSGSDRRSTSLVPQVVIERGD